MPYKSINDLPDSVKDNLPKSAQTIWKNAYNHADSEGIENPSQYAWGAVKKAYKKDKEGKWVKKKMSLPCPMSLESDEFIFTMPTDDGGWARLYFQISKAEWEKLSLEEQQAFIKQIPVKLQATAAKVHEFSTKLFGYDEPDAEEKIEWVRDDISSIWNTIWSNKEQFDTEIDAINQRIDDLITIFSGITRLAAEARESGGDSSGGDTRKQIRGVFQYEEPLRWNRSGDVLKIEGTLIAEGVWTGIDGQTVFYPRSIFLTAVKGILSASIKRGHDTDEDSVVGFVTEAVVADDRINIKGIVYNRDAIQDVALGTLGGLSMEADVHAIYSEEQKVYVATDMELLKATLVENPACNTCLVGAMYTVALKKNEEKKVSSKELKLLENPLFTDVVATLKEAEVGEAVMLKVLELLRKAVKSQMNAELEAQIEELKGKLTAKDEELEVKQTALDAKETEHTEAVTKKDEEITKLSEELETIKTAEVATLLEKIKLIDKDFDEKDLIEDIGLDKQKVILQKYLGSVVKLAANPLRVEGVTGLEDTEAKVTAMLQEMGITDVKAFLEG